MTTVDRTMTGDHAVIEDVLAVRTGEIGAADAHFFRGSETVVRGCSTAYGLVT